MKNNSIIKLNHTNKAHVSAVPHLHQTLLPESVLSKIGYLFLNKFYYKILTKDELIDVYLYQKEGEYVGFISCTNFPFTFMKEGIKNHFIYLGIYLFLSTFIRPRAVVSLFKKQNDQTLNNLNETYGDTIGQFMSFGVLEKHRKHIDSQSGKTIPHTLMETVFKNFKINKKELFFLLVLKSNKIAKRFYEKNNGIKSSDIIGESDIYLFNLKK